uniref:Uncharacterized protein n=1 Tax=Pyrodinium bahamense TaxID=73915 RepID=A0A7S0FGB9_9DINO|mmetsp:Transcript_29535/g.81148  ORF Transcript_29535/g.81148 Transcript_29535/m.81148 type:complete len:344 (+) Transcript_29535:125-1156(+)|eukprot:CAMPEP_0179031186 /NCGR_PEP_ID=MMETSP0796-20121207/10942_1 /TAXON_ID=73915 /ORGANISM="Pyrodinium bahamense, Strain pbaha01" /LENGTH=343 /DNA_ID=CAMNT_0020727373 /DNA_START=78 /DNA_END=1109 /DNA_ORIENTATION=-
MKLKRFLLRYEPPGVGLEVEDNGVTDVRHKDLRRAAEVRSTKHINMVVDELIAQEPTILVKHRATLVQLLCRLYGIESGSADTTGEEAQADAHSPREEQRKPAPHHTSPAESSGLQEGQQVVLVGLKGDLQVHNGELGTLTKLREEKGKYEVLLNSGVTRAEILKFRSPDNIVPVVPSGVLIVGSQAVMRGLHNHPELNGCFCRVVRHYDGAQRFEVRAIDSGLHFRMKPDNLLPVLPCAHSLNVVLKDAGEDESPQSGASDRSSAPFQRGSIVQIFGLKSTPAFNGQLAEVLSVDCTKGRYAIRLRDGSEKTIRMGNVRLASGPASFHRMRAPAAIDSRLWG